MAGCGLEIDEEVLDMMSPEVQAVKNSLKDSNVKLGLQQIMKALVQMVPQNVEDTLIENIVRPFILSDDDYKKIMAVMEDNFNMGLGKETQASAKVKMYQTYVKSVPDGTEKGDFLALDLGGTNFRVLLINLDGQEVKMESKIFLIPQQIMLGTGVQLFDHIAECIFKFMKDHNLMDKVLPLGFTFSFPCRQVGLDKAILTSWTKGFKCAGVEGNDIVQLLHEAIVRRGDIKVNCLAVINDTVGALMSCAHSDNLCAIGLILGTGTNACYIEQLENVELWDGDRKDPQEVIINTEWCAFGEDGAIDFIMTDYDRIVDERSINAGDHIFEKMISGMYLGEIVRLVLVRLCELTLLFDGKESEELSTERRFYTKYISEIERDIDDHFMHTKAVFEELHIKGFTDVDCSVVQHVCTLISTRAAFLTAAGTGTNACYIEKLENVELWDGDMEEPQQVIINTEWGALGDDGNLEFIMTDYDKKVDKHSINCGRQIYEKMISGMYMGEIVRLVLEKLRKHGLVFNGRGSEELSTMGRFYTKYVSEIESDVDDHFKNTKQVLEELNIQKYTEEDCRIVQHVCCLISTRAAYLASAGIAVLLNKMNRPDVAVAVDGSLYRFHPHFHDLMVEKTKQLVNPGINFRLMLSHDGSGKGAALVAAVAHRVQEQKEQERMLNGVKDLSVSH